MDLTSKIINDDFVWEMLVSHLPGKKKNSSKQFVNINCPYCPQLGEGVDMRMRCGIRNNNPGVGIHCFNCGLKTKWSPGELIPRKMQSFMECLGIDDVAVKQANHKAFRYRSFLSSSSTTEKVLDTFHKPVFHPSHLPPESQSFTAWADQGNCDPDFLDVVTYLYDRGNDIAEFGDYYWTPSKHHEMNRRVIVPFYHENQLVGFTARSADTDSKNRYFKSTQEDFLFNMASASIAHRKYIIITEGIFDAIAIDCVGSLGSSLNKTQINWLNSYGRKIIIVPDPDQAGQHMIDIAMANNWSVAFPRLRRSNGKDNWWDASIKDVADAVKSYGQIYSLQSIIASSTSNNLEINFKRKLLF